MTKAIAPATRCVSGNPPRLVLREQLGRRSPAGLILEINEGPAFGRRRRLRQTSRGATLAVGDAINHTASPTIRMICVAARLMR